MKNKLTEKERVAILRGCGASAGFGETAKHAIDEAEKRMNAVHKGFREEAKRRKKR